jgi:deoxyribodipyrimidine photo-lyase
MAQKPDSPSEAPALLWLRRDLRLSDHPALAAAVEAGAPIVPVYILDDETPGEWQLGGASRWWLAQSLRSLAKSLRGKGSRLILRCGCTDTVLAELIAETGAKSVYFTRGYEPYQRELEDRLKPVFARFDVEGRSFTGHILFEPERLLNKSGEPFRVFTPFSKAAAAISAAQTPLPAPSLLPSPSAWPASDGLESLGLEPSRPDWAAEIRAAWACGEEAAQERLRQFIEGRLANYADRRNFPGEEATSRLSPHLAFGEISPRQIWQAVQFAAEAGHPEMAEPYLREIMWREFSYHVLFHFPALPKKPFRPEFGAFPWHRNNEALRAWRKGKTGYPIVDAGMRQLWRAGWMHNRVRMIAASFFVKHLLLPWQAGEAWFWDTLVDADLANNAASWQWVAGSGADAAPYFRIFNPVLQGLKFDPEGEYIRAFCPELAKLPAQAIHKPWEAEPHLLAEAGVKLGETYPRPIVDHDAARQRALAAFASIRRAS